MPPQSDNPERSWILSHPELNPLHNPILGRHRGRWAEVYFSSPLEKRDEAVQHLIRELEEQEASGPELTPLPPGQIQDSQVRNVASCARAERVTCLWCGCENQPQYKSCRCCGDRLSVPAEEPPAEGQAQGDVAASLFNSESRILPSMQAVSSTGVKFGRFRSDRRIDKKDDRSISHRASELPLRSYRPYVAAMLALAILGLAFMARRGAGTTSGASQAAPKPPPALTTSASSTTSTPSTAQPDTSSAASPSARGTAGDAPVTAASLSPKAVPDTTHPTLPVVPSPNGSLPHATWPKGIEELGIARDFLRGTNGKPRNASQAAQWLWQAVAQKNVDATVFLAGLYLRGEGVAKSCQQARLLLDAAALRGRQDAADELRHLSAFGCE